MGGKGVGKISTYSYFVEGVKPILTYYFPSRYFILEIARSSGLAGIIFHLRLEGKKRIGMSCFLLVLQRLDSVKYNFIMFRNEMESYVRIGGGV